MNINEELKKFDEAEKALTKQIDDEVALEEEIQEVALYTAKALANSPMVPFTIQNRDFIVVAATHKGPKGEPMIQLVAREKLAIVTPEAKIIKADLIIDTNFTKEENLIAGIKAILGHITGCIKPEVLE
jgi:hypothetical protein|nr:MAG TPA: hypothetical protein [Caudoviricetes sp.]